ncbi:Yip1 family protein [Saccharibacillus sp. CPCC 101409]|uniref:Yip1 family protein n=1 Tax=Saccharibacillus sp. CPCC 101409 TaxID=3058041 RepID=UPI00267186A5|nr:Yip1 family protein [Saccharibacillus sp. CPCC 101409]MDO3410751.1 Yip1 family protein [Saccharibacillus sp. CPCC 101409]
MDGRNGGGRNENERDRRDSGFGPDLRKEGDGGRGAYGSPDNRYSGSAGQDVQSGYGTGGQERYPGERSAYDQGGRRYDDRAPEAEPIGSPWLNVWIHPRQVTSGFIRSGNPTRNALVLAMIAGIFNSMNSASARNLGDTMSMGELMGSFLVGGAVGGLLTYYIGSYLLKLIGGWLGGKGTLTDMRVVVGRIAGMLSIGAGLVWIPELLIAGREMFTEATPVLDASPFKALLLLAFGLLEAVLGIWAFVALLHGLGEAHRFSAWTSLLAEIILGLGVFILVAIIVVIAVIITGGF